MFCPKCGSSNPEDAIFCQECGAKIVSQTKKAEPLSIKKKLLIGEAVLFIVLIIGAFQLGEKKFGAEAAASEYFEQIMNGDWEGAYENLEIEEKPFLSKELFVKVNKDIERKEYTSYKAEAGNPLLEGKEPIKEINISYRLKGASETSNMKLKLVKDGKKQLIFFDSWKIVPDKYIAHDYSIQVPKGVKVQLDNIKVNDTYCADDLQAAAGSMDKYVIPDLFAGSHELVLKQENMADVKDMITTEDNEYYIENMPIKKEVKEELVKKAAADLKTIYIQGFQQADFSKMKSLFTKDTASLYDLQYGYNNFKENFQEYNNDMGLNSVIFTNIEGTVTHEYKADNSIFEVQLDYFYNSRFKAISWDGTFRTDISNETGTNTFVYVFEDGKWVIKSFDFNAV